MGHFLCLLQIETKREMMQGVKKLARSGSLIVEELFGNKTKRMELEPAEVEYEAGFNGETDINII